jgi:glycosyltransferase involved in cell wall biosynthesis
LASILRDLGFLSREQVNEVQRAEARWVAQALHADIGPQGFPYPAFFSLCMPAFNEQDNIEDTLDSACAILPQFVERFEVVAVDDGSRDHTGEVVARYAERVPQVRLERHPQNRGYGAAVTTGLRAARGDLVAFTDSDGQFSFLDLPQLLIRLEDNDAVIGYRYQRADNCVRKLNAWCWGQLIRIVLGVQVRDLDCAFKLFRREVVDCLELTSTGAAINAEILSQCVRGGL